MKNKELIKEICSNSMKATVSYNKMVRVLRHNESKRKALLKWLKTTELPTNTTYEFVEEIIRRVEDL